MAAASNNTSPSPKPPHVVTMPFPLQGHITPLMQLSKLLAARGFSITFVSSDFNIRQMQKAKQRLMVNDMSKLVGIRLVGIPDGAPEEPLEHNQKTLLASLPVLHKSFDELVGKMVQDQQEIEITCIISDSFLTWTQDVADKWGIPRIAFWPQSLAAFACSMSLPNIMEACPGLDPFINIHQGFKREASMVLNCIPGLAGIDTRSLPFLSPNELGAEWLRSTLRVLRERVNEPLCLFCNTMPDLEREVHTHLSTYLPLCKPFLTLGPLLPLAFLDDSSNDNGTGSSLFDEDNDCLQWLDLQRPRSVLYISLGSILLLNERDVDEIAMGLEASQVPFLWVLKSGTTESLIALQKTQGKVIRWAPQLQVLSHEAVGGFLTHCGWNSVLESVSMGVPVIGWPQMMDQLTNCWFQVEKLKMGLRLEVDASNKVSRASIEHAVQTLMTMEEGKQMRDHASRFSSLVEASFKTSLPSNVDTLVHTILFSCRKISSHDQRKA